MSKTYQTSLTLLGRLNDRYDQNAWEDFAKAYGDYIFVIIVKMGVKTSDTEDLRQQVLLKLWDKLPEFSYDSSKRFRSYIATVTKNQVNDFYRHLKTKNKHVQQHEDLESTSNIVELDKNELDDLAEKEWELHILNLALKNIESSFKGQAIEVFKLSLEGESSQDIANRLSLKQDSVSKLLRRVKSKMLEEIHKIKLDLE